MDFGALPPEVNSGRMYCGPGSAPMVAAASAWNGLAAELSVAAVGYERVITTLQTEEWLGPASTLMVEAVAPYVAWMRATAIQAEQAASQARAAAAAYETAFAAIVPPPLIAANRARLTSLVTHNVFGQNTASIAATEAQYAEMWAQDAMAMYGYAGSSATATKVTPFAPPPNTTSPSAAATQLSAVAKAAGTSAGAAQSAIAELIAHLPNTLLGLTSPLSSALTAAATRGGWNGSSTGICRYHSCFTTPWVCHISPLVLATALLHRGGRWDGSVPRPPKLPPRRRRPSAPRLAVPDPYPRV